MPTPAPEQSDHEQQRKPDIARDISSSDSDKKTQETPFANPLPGSDEVWGKCSLGPPSKWPAALQVYSATLASFAYPAAIFWDEEFTILHNSGWLDAGGVDCQGQTQRGKLKADAFSALWDSLHGGKPKKVASQALLRTEDNIDPEHYTVLISPLFDGQNKKESASGLLAQLLPQHDRQDNEQGEKLQPERGSLEPRELGDLYGQDKGPEFDISQLGRVMDSVPLDEHPFFHRFAEMLPSGLAILDHKAQAVFVNQHFYELTTHTDDDKSFKSWPQSIHPDDYDRVMDAYHDAFTSQKQLRTEFRAQKIDNPWRLLLLTPLGEENLQHVSLREYGGFICSVVDITSEKSAELSEREAAKQATERRVQQERFMDMISHEIRNPLSAVLHCSEDIEEAIRDRNNVDFATIKESTETINLCISHQKNIVDDVLSFSKLDASMLTLTPKSCQPSQQLASSMKMFQPEFRKQRLEFGFSVDRSYPNHSIHWVMADLARINQVLINLVSNAIKFTTKTDREKSIVVKVGASSQRPASYPPDVVFFSQDATYRMDATNAAEWGDGEPAYIMVSVKDTGIGISEEGQQRLFQRFQQATPKTEETYGGSGLGLNISRKLCHLHGGEIGVSSEKGSGSTFGFFFKVRRSERPQDYTGSSEDGKVDEEELRTETMDPDTKAKDPDTKSLDESDRGSTWESLKSMSAKASETIPHPNRQQGGSEQRRNNSGTKSEATPGKESLHKKDMGAPKNSTDEHKDQPDRSDGALSSQNQRVHVLLCEDNTINQRIISRKLKSKGFEVTTANNGREAVDATRDAIKAAAAEKGVGFDVILMDKEMPEMDGNAATKAIRVLEEESEMGHVPILGVTANVRGAQQDEMLQAGMDDVISKPYKIEDMVAKINDLTGGKS